MIRSSGMRPIIATLMLLVMPAIVPADPIQSAIDAGDHATAEALLRERLETDQGNELLEFRLAQVLAWSGAHPQALAVYDRLLAESPDNVDYVFGRALVLAAMERDGEAYAAARRAAGLAPDYEAVRRLEFRLARNHLADEGMDELREDAARRFPDARWWRQSAGGAVEDRVAAARYYVTGGASYDDLSGGRAGWQQQFVRVDRQAGEGTDYHGTLSRHVRFGQTDTELRAGAVHSFREAWLGSAELALTGGADFLADMELQAGIRRRLGDGWSVKGGLRQRRYADATVTIWSAEAERYFGDYRAAYTLNAARLHGGTTSFSHVGSLGWYPREGMAFGLVLATGEEAEAIGPGLILETDVDSITLTGRHSLSDRIDIDWWVGSHRQGDIYRRRYAGVAVRYGL